MKTINKQRVIIAAVICPEYCRYGVKNYVSINHSNCHRRNCYSSTISDCCTEIQHLNWFYLLLRGAFGRRFTAKRRAVTKLLPTFVNLLSPAAIRQFLVITHATMAKDKKGLKQYNANSFRPLLCVDWKEIFFMKTKYMEISNFICSDIKLKNIILELYACCFIVLTYSACINFSSMLTYQPLRCV